MDNWHGKPMAAKTADAIAAIKSIIVDESAHIDPILPTNDLDEVDISNIRLDTPPDYKLGELIATRVAYGKGLPKLGANNTRVVAMDGDTKNSTYAIFFKVSITFLHYNILYILYIHQLFICRMPSQIDSSNVLLLSRI